MDTTFGDLQERLRALWPAVTLRSIGDIERTVVVVHSVSLDVPDQLIPVFGSDPALNWLGTKKGSRRVFEEEGVLHPVGLEVDGEGELTGALRELRERRPEARMAVLKLDEGVSGLGNAIVDLETAESD